MSASQSPRIARLRAFCPACDGLGIVVYPPFDSPTLCGRCDGCGMIDRAPTPCLACGDTGLEETVAGVVLCTACHPPQPGEVREVVEPSTPRDWLAITVFLALSALGSGALVWAAFAWAHR